MRCLRCVRCDFDPSATVKALEDSTVFGISKAGMEDDADEPDGNVLDRVYLVGEQFDRMLKRVLVSQACINLPSGGADPPGSGRGSPLP